ncbi:MAG: xanthine dehydrogenase family protein molybdopterin-binding subunit [Pseudomonadota bacterium]
MERDERQWRVDGLQKVSGQALYVDDLRESDLGFDYDHGVIVTSAIGRGRIARIDTAEAEAMPGVRAVMTYKNAPRLRKVTSITMSEISEVRPLQSARILNYGQAIAVVVAKTRAQAQVAATKIKVSYAEEPGVYALEDAKDRLVPVKRAGMAPGKIKKGDAHGLYAESARKIDACFHSAPYHHNAIEPGAAIAKWDEDGGLTVHAATQWHHSDSLALGQAFGLGMADGLPGFFARKLLGRVFERKVRLHNHLAGGAFGRNLAMTHMFLAAMAAKLSGHGVKIALTRKQTFSLLTYRGEVEQRVRLGAAEDGKLEALIVDPECAKGAAGRYVEPVGSWSCQVYGQKSHFLQHRVAKLDMNANGWMRGPGGASAMFALEGAMDELAHDAGIDPFELRLRNYAQEDSESGKPWSDKSLRACYDAGAEAIGWQQRPTGGSARSDGRLIGFGMATSYQSCWRFPASAGLSLGRDGRVTLSATVAEMGQGTQTGLHTLAAEAMGVPRAAIDLDTDRTGLPAGAGSLASTGFYSNAASLWKAAKRVKADLFQHATSQSGGPFEGLDPKKLTIEDGYILAGGNRRQSLADAMQSYPKAEIDAVVTTGRDLGRSKSKKAVFGAIFTEISVDPITMELRVERMVGAFAGGRIVNPNIVKGQLVGSMIWGIGQALMEKSKVDRLTGRWLNAELGEALIATQADVAEIRAITVEDSQPTKRPIGIKGLSEVAVLGPAPAIASAFFDATGKRLRSLPMRIEDRLAAPVERRPQ